MHDDKPQIGIRREDKNPWEGRVPLIPEHVARLVSEQGLRVTVQPSDLRAFSADEYKAAGARIDEDLDPCDVVFAVKQIPTELLRPDGTYVFFSHTIKGQPDNMPMLQTVLNQKSRLIDYELICDEGGRRLIFFGRHAGLVGMINSLWSLGRRLEIQGHQTPLASIRQAIGYDDLDQAKDSIRSVGEQIAKQGLPQVLGPMVVGFAGYGNVSRGAQEIFDLLPHELIQADQLAGLDLGTERSANFFTKVVFFEKDMVDPIDPAGVFDLQEYYDQPQRYRSKMEAHLPYLDVLINAIYWDTRYPRLVTNDYLREACTTGALRLKVIGDITCDIDGSVQCNMRATDSGNPVYVYDCLTGQTTDGVVGNGPVVLATDNLPCELPKESSRAFSTALAPFVSAIASADFTKNHDQAGLPDPIRRAVIAWNGELTAPFQKLKPHLEKATAKDR